MEKTRTTMILDTPTYRRLVECARQNERSTSAELRVAVREHVRANLPAAPRAADKLGRGAAVEVQGAA